MIQIATKAQGIHSFIEVDWLHFIETIMFWASIHVQCMSFRQAVRSGENGKSLPVKSMLGFFSTSNEVFFNSHTELYTPVSRKAHRIICQWSVHYCTSMEQCWQYSLVTIYRTRPPGSTLRYSVAFSILPHPYLLQLNAYAVNYPS